MSDEKNFVYRFQLEEEDAAVKRFTREVKEAGGVLDIEHEERRDGGVVRLVEYSGPVDPEPMKRERASGARVEVDLLDGGSK